MNRTSKPSLIDPLLVLILTAVALAAGLYAVNHFLIPFCGWVTASVFRAGAALAIAAFVLLLDELRQGPRPNRTRVR